MTTAGNTENKNRLPVRQKSTVGRESHRGLSLLWWVPVGFPWASQNRTCPFLLSRLPWVMGSYISSSNTPWQKQLLATRGQGRGRGVSSNAKENDDRTCYHCGVKGHVKVDCKFRIRGEEALAQRGKRNGRGNGLNSKRQKKEADVAIATIGDMDADDSF